MKPSETMTLPAFGERIASILVSKYGKSPDDAIAMLREQKGTVVGWYQRECDTCVASNAAGEIINRSGETRLKTPTSTVLAASAPAKVYGVVPHAIITAASDFPRVFGLRGFPSDLFRISLASSFTKDGYVILYTQRFNRATNEWSDFAKGTVLELEPEVSDPPDWFPQKSPAR